MTDLATLAHNIATSTLIHMGFFVVIIKFLPLESVTITIFLSNAVLIQNMFNTIYIPIANCHVFFVSSKEGTVFKLELLVKL